MKAELEWRLSEKKRTTPSIEEILDLLVKKEASPAPMVDLSGEEEVNE